MTGSIEGLRILVVEDEHLVALSMCDDLEDAGAIVIGPADSVDSALALVGGTKIDAAVLDIQLQSEMVFPVAEQLRGDGVPFLFTTGFDSGVLPDDYMDVPKCEKPASGDMVMAMLAQLVAR